MAVTALQARPKLRDMTILDQHGDPIVTTPTARRIAQPNPRGMQTFNSHPAIGLTVENLLSYYLAAENGSPVRQFDMFDDLIERYSSVGGMLNDRNEDVSGCDFAVLPPLGRADKQSTIAAQRLDESLHYNPGFRNYMEHSLTAVPFGFACTNLVWDTVDGAIVPTIFAPIAQRRFGAPGQARANEILLIDATEGAFTYQDLEPGLWSVTRYHHRNPYAAGLMRSISWWILFALTNFKQWQIFADMFGLPIALGYYEEGASGPSRAALEDAVRSIGQDGYAVLSSLTELVIKESTRGGDSSTVYPQILAVCEAMITKLITGGTLNTDVSSTGAGSYNAATVHESRLFKMKRRDATRFQDGFVESIGRTFVAWNGYDRAAAPRIQVKIARDELQRAQAIEIIGQAMPISKTQMQEEFNLREPANAADSIMFPTTAPPDPGHAREDKQK